MPLKCVVVGGGAAGIFAAVTAKRVHPEMDVLVIEKTNKLLSKVRISGGGRCNLTHSCFDPKELVQNYPRGHKELLGPLHRFQPADTLEWFHQRGVETKTEPDGRMFPTSDSSGSVVHCLLNEAKNLGVVIETGRRIESIERDDDGFRITLQDGDQVQCDKLILATGSSPQGHRFAMEMGHTIEAPVPSLFTFNIPIFELEDLAGASVEPAGVSLVDSKLSQEGPLLITHWGFSGPAALKLSAWGARELHEKKYKAQLAIDWLPKTSEEQLKSFFEAAKKDRPKKSVGNEYAGIGLPKKLWRRLLELIGIQADSRLCDLGQKLLIQLCSKLKRDVYQVDGKTTNKEEFVTCGGVKLSEVNFKRMESKHCPGLHFAGEILDIDGVTGGFNFQNAWTTGWIAGHAVGE